RRTSATSLEAVPRGFASVPLRTPPRTSSCDHFRMNADVHQYAAVRLANVRGGMLYFEMGQVSENGWRIDEYGRICAVFACARRADGRFLLAAPVRRRPARRVKSAVAGRLRARA